MIDTGYVESKPIIYVDPAGKYAHEYYVRESKDTSEMSYEVKKLYRLLLQQKMAVYKYMRTRNRILIWISRGPACKATEIILSP